MCLKAIAASTNIFTPVSLGNAFREELSYDPNGNIKTYQRYNETVPLNNYSYTYTGNTNRLASIYNGETNTTTDYYYDEIGNTSRVMATYVKDPDINSNNLTLTERHKYGCSLLGINRKTQNVDSSSWEEIIIFEKGNDRYILTDHLGNTRVEITDKKIQQSVGSNKELVLNDRPLVTTPSGGVLIGE